MKLYRFDGIDEPFELLPLAARRALDAAGLKLSRAGWQSLALDDRRKLISLGASPEINVSEVRALVAVASPAPEAQAAPSEPNALNPPSELTTALGSERPLTTAVWSALSPLDRYALVKASQSWNSQRLTEAYREIIGQSAWSTHVEPGGGARMVGVGEKTASLRRAVAVTRVRMSPEAFTRLEQADAPKGDVLGTARIAGIQAAKKTWELIPLCHPLALTKISVSFESAPAEHALTIRAEVEAFDRTGVEMEAMTAVSVAALTVYDMLKGIDRAMDLGPTRLLEKSGGRGGDFRAV